MRWKASAGLSGDLLGVKGKVGAPGYLLLKRLPNQPPKFLSPSPAFSDTRHKNTFCKRDGVIDVAMSDFKLGGFQQLCTVAQTVRLCTLNAY